MECKSSAKKAKALKKKVVVKNKKKVKPAKAVKKVESQPEVLFPLITYSDLDDSIENHLKQLPPDTVARTLLKQVDDGDYEEYDEQDEDEEEKDEGFED